MAKQPLLRKEPTMGRPASGAEVEKDEPAIEVVHAESGAGGGEAKAAEPSLAEQLAETKKQLEASQSAIAEERRRREEAEQAALENAGKAETNEQAALRNHESAVRQAQEATKGTLVAAKRDYAAAMEAGDYVKAADAQEQIAVAAQQVRALEAEVGKIERYKEGLKNRPTATARPTNAAGVDVSAMPRPAQDWLAQHPEFLADARKFRKLSAGHTDALAEGYVAYSPEYFQHVEQFVGLKGAAPADGAVRADQQPRGTGMPASRSGEVQPARATGATQVALTAREREAAHASWPELTPHEAEVRYAEQKLILIQEGRIGRPN